MRILCHPLGASGVRAAAPACFAGISRQVLSAQSSVKLSQAMLSQAMLSQAMLSQATLSQAMLSQATLSQATLSQAKLSHATLFQTTVSQVSTGQKMPPNSGAFHCSGGRERTGYSARAHPAAGRRPRWAPATAVAFARVPTGDPPGRTGSAG